MHRMLDAAEVLLDAGGTDALTVDAVVRDADASIGSFYARFGDRQGLVVALQDRFLRRLDESLGPAFQPADDSDLETALGYVVASFLAAFRSNRQAFVAFVLVNRSEPPMRARGARASFAAASAIARLLERHADEVAHPDPELAADVVYRTLFAMAMQTVMFDDGEISRHVVTDDELARETTRLVLAYLRAP
ncbi:MAG: TetR/AcrR family transcriptional regulator [Actinomycetota bacterium]